MKWIYVERSMTVITTVAAGIGLFGSAMKFVFFCLGFAVAGCFYLLGRRFVFHYEIATLPANARTLFDELVKTTGRIDIKGSRAYLNGVETQFDLSTVNMLLNRGFVRCDRGMILNAQLDATYSLTAKGVLAHQLNLKP